ncbi:hypothetical protein V2J09_016763 [Rumex salicifolius]
MGFRLPSVISNTKKMIKQSSLSSKNSQQKGHLAVYVGLEEEKIRYVVPLSVLNHPLFHDLLSRAEEEYGFDHPTGGLTIPCDEQTFEDLISQLN